MRLVTFWVCCIGALAQVETPSIGLMLDESGQLRPVLGVAGNFMLGMPSGFGGELEASLELAHAVVFTNDEELIVKRADASEVRFALNGVSGLRAMSADWVQVVAGARSYALRIEAGREALFALPGVPKVEARRR
jgi:hypothetical protein